MDVGIVACDEQSKSEVDGVGDKSNTPISKWGEILVTGGLKTNAILDGQTPAWLDLGTYAREVFRTQDRRFVLGFTLCGSIMRLWQFDGRAVLDPPRLALTRMDVGLFMS